MAGALARWEAGGAHLPVRVEDARGGTVPVAVWWRRVDGNGVPWTFLHGFPTSSYDWHRVDALLPPGVDRLYLDLPGFGASGKPRGVAWSFDLWLDAVAAVWRAAGIRRTRLICHDLSVSVAQELVARQAEGRWAGPEVTDITLLNGGLFADVYRPIPLQRLLSVPGLGALVARAATARTFDRAMRRIGSPHHPLPREDLDAMWASVRQNGGRGIYHELSRYHGERRRHRVRWQDAMAASAVPVSLLWGALDPISGADMVAAVRTRVPRAKITVWDDVGHYVPLEVPQRVASALLRTG